MDKYMENFSSKMTASDAANFLKVNLQAIHKQLKSKNFECQKNQNRVFFGFETAKEIFKLKFEKKVLAFQIVKGGTGKTSLAFSFAIRANLYGARVLCIDLDQQGNLTHAFKVDASNSPVMIDIINEKATITDSIINISPGLDLLPSRIENAAIDKVMMINNLLINEVYLDLIKPIIKNYDYIIFDCPPALGHSVAAATLASDFVIAPVTPEQFGLSGLQMTYEEIAALNKKYHKNVELKIVINKFDSRTSLSTDVIRTVLNNERFKEKTCSSIIRISQEFANTIFSGKNIYSSLKNTTAKEDVDVVVREILKLDELREKRNSKEEVAA